RERGARLRGVSSSSFRRSGDHRMHDPVGLADAMIGQPLRDVLRVVGIAGSLRRSSYNRALLCAAQQLTPPSLVIDVELLDEIPMFNADLDGETTPPTVARLRQAVREADGLLLVTPEYNHGVPGVLKNAIDWLSQPLAQCALDGKPTALMGAS